MKKSSLLIFSFLLKSASPNKCFTYLKRRLPKSDVKTLDKTLTARCRLLKIKHWINLYLELESQALLPRELATRLQRVNVRPSPNMCSQALKDEIERLRASADSLRDFLRGKADFLYSLDFLSFLKFQSFCSNAARHLKSKLASSSLMTRDEAVPWSPGFYPTPLEKHITNLSSHSLSDIEKQALCRGLNFCIPHNKPQAVVDAEFENFYQQLQSLQAPDVGLTKFKADLVSLSKSFSQKFRHESPLTKCHSEALSSLRSNDDLVICRPDKGNAIVLLDRCDYVQKMSLVLADSTKFERDEFQIDLTHKIEKQVSSSVSRLAQQHVISRATAKSLTPSGSCIPKLYGLPKTHKDGMPLRPILSMVNTPTHRLAQWLAQLLQPVRDAVSSFNVQDSFDFVNRVRSLDISNSFFCSFDVTSLFTNVPLVETISQIKIICDHFHIELPIDFDFLQSLILLCTQNIQFSFNQILYFQKDGVAMGSPLGPILADIFLGFIETFHLKQSEFSPLHFFRFVDDTFAVFSSPSSVQPFLDLLNNLHPNLRFTCELERNNSLPFLDVLVQRSDAGQLLTSVYRKPTWTGLYSHFLSFVPMSYKRNLVFNLFHRARRICSANILEAEHSLLRSTLEANGYPSRFIDRHSQPKPDSPVLQGPSKMPAFLFLPFLGDQFSSHLKRTISSLTAAVYPAAKPRIVFQTRRVGVRPLKDKVPFARSSNLLYEFRCSCGSSYLGRTTRALADRMAEHLPRWLLAGSNQRPRSTAAPASAITRHVISCQQFDRSRPTDSNFKVVAKSRHPALLPLLEATHIVTRQPDLCSQKDFVFCLALPWN
jgi:hypothetical protein